MDNVNKTPVGSLKISKSVITTIARTAALEVGGVASLPDAESGGMRFAKGFGRRPIRVTLSDDFATIDLSLVLESSARIPDVCAKVQGAVKESVQTMTGIAVSKVNVLVAGVAFASEDMPF